MKVILFDLDGTLLPMDQDLFTKTYFKDLCKKLIPHGYEPEHLIKSVWAGTGRMVRNDGARTNEEVFWEAFAGIYGDKVFEHKPIFEDFYANEFGKAQAVCGHNPQVGSVIKELKERGYRVVLASNPLFPEVAQKSRMNWAGVDPDDFEYITTYENSHYCKPNPKYYSEILDVIGCDASDCLMVGNDATEDMVAAEVGIDTFLVMDCLLNKEEKDISAYRKGSFSDLMDYIRACEA